LFEVWSERKPGVHHLMVFGCIVLGRTLPRTLRNWKTEAGR
jgi:hypothetical protein